MSAYRIELTPDDNGTLLVSCPALPEVTTFGDDEDDALRHAADAVAEALAARISVGGEIPLWQSYARVGDHLVMLPVQIMVKVSLYWMLQRAQITRAELARRLGWHREQVDRLFRLDHASRLDQLDAAAEALGSPLSDVIRRDLVAAASEADMLELGYRRLSEEELNALHSPAQRQNVDGTEGRIKAAH
jgi:antitoxin HicB